MKITSFSSQFIANQIKRTSLSISENLLRISSERRILRPSDDNVSFSLARRLDSKASSLGRAVESMNRAFASLDTARLAVVNQIAIVEEMKSLAEAAADPDALPSLRQSLQEDMMSFSQDFQNIATNTEFLGTRLLDGSSSSISAIIDERGQSRQLNLRSTRSGDVFRSEQATGEYEFGYFLPGGSATELVDLNDDGNLDRVVNAAGVLSISFGNGTGGFSGGAKISASSAAIDFGDLTGSGTKDIVSIDSAGLVSVYEYDGAGGFSLASTFQATAGSPQWIKVGDLTGNGFVDVLVKSDTTQLEVFENDGDGSFVSASTVDLALASFGQIEIADLDGNGSLDIIAMTDTTGQYETLLNDGAGTFTSEFLSVAEAVGSRKFLLGDFTGNGTQDILIYNFSGGNTISVREGFEDGNFSGTSLNSAYTLPSQLRAIDYNFDGRMDLISIGNLGSINFLLNNGSGTFSVAQTLDTGIGGVGLAVGDLNNDGYSDFMYGSSSRTSEVYLASTQDAAAPGLLDLTTQEAAEKTIEILDQALEKLSEIEIQFQTQMDLLEFTQESASSLQELNLELGEELLAVDLVRENAELTKNQILQEAQLAALSQANFSADLAVSLLRALTTGFGSNS
jgi:flagellin